MRNLVDPGEFSAIDRRRHRLLNALFKALESQGGKIRQGDRRELLAEFSGEKIEFHLREKQQQGRRPLTPEELRWRSPGGKDWRQELQPTGRLIFDIKTYLPVGLRRQWIETELHPLEDSLPEIVAAFVAAGPLLLQQRRDREAAERERQLAARKRYEEEQQRKKDTNQWRRFKELAESYQQLSAIREFVTKLQSLDADPDTLVHGRSIADWLSWAESWLYRADPTAGGINGVFQAVGNISEWSYRD
jgi:Skp family chaperone for outer membrane proteins